MTLRIGTMDFDSFDGEILLPQRSTHRFESPAVAYAGVQVLPNSAPPFALKCIRMTPAALLVSDAEIINASVGQIVPIVHDALVYEYLPYRLVFIVLSIQINETRKLPLVSGSRYGTPYTYTPGGQITTTITLQAVPLT
jgi:hypothetical protein